MPLVIYGGNFCPVSVAHVTTAEAIRDFLEKIDSVRVTESSELSESRETTVLMVTDFAPIHRDVLLGGDERHNMVVKALVGRPGLQAYRSEKALNEVVDEVQLLHPGEHLYLVVGPDYMDPAAKWYLPKWQMGPALINKCRIITHPRGGGVATLEQVRLWATELEGEFKGARVFVVDSPMMNISSTMVRERASKAESLQGLVPDAIIPDVIGYFGPKTT